MNLIQTHQSNLLSSDWHVLHRNIYFFTAEARGRISGLDLGDGRLDMDTFLQAEKATYQRLLAELEAMLKTGNFDRFIFLGDLIFGLDRRKGLAEKIEMIDAELPEFRQFFDLLKAEGIQRTLIVGNHDDYKQQNAGARALYAELFDEVVRHIQEENVYYTHFPIGYGLAQDKTMGTPEEKLYRISKSFKKLDQELVAEIGTQEIINFHGHIHQGEFPYALPQVNYRNMAIDIVVLQDENT